MEKKGGSGTLDQIGAIWVEEIGEGGLATLREIPSYVCGHCNTVIAMRAERTRERVSCRMCGSLICEKSQLCREACSPIHQLAQDHFENVDRYAPYAMAVLNGAQTFAEAEAFNKGVK